MIKTGRKSQAARVGWHFLVMMCVTLLVVPAGVMADPPAAMICATIASALSR